MSISEALKAAIDEQLEGGKKVYRIARESGIGQPVLSRIMTGERTLTLPTADRLAEYLGLELQPKTIKKGKRQ